MKRLYIILAVIILVTGYKFFNNYTGIYSPKTENELQQDNVIIPSLELSSYEDSYNKTTGGIALVDLSHENSFETDELNVLIKRILVRNYSVKYLRNKSEMNETLRTANTFIVISPNKQFSEEEINLVEDFQRDDGNLLLVDDPARKSKINLLSMSFGIIFNRDYLYNNVANDGNYRYVIFTDFNEDNLTKGLSKVSFYVAGSISGTMLIKSDTNTYSSLGTKEIFSPVVKNGRTLAIGDITFLTPPYNTIYDNNKFISNIADFITSSSKITQPEE